MIMAEYGSQRSDQPENVNFEPIIRGLTITNFHNFWEPIPNAIVIYELIYAIMLISRSSKSNLSSCRVYNPGCPPLSELGRWTLTRFYFLLRPFPTYTCFFTASPCRFLNFEHFLTSFFATPDSLFPTNMVLHSIMHISYSDYLSFLLT